MTAREGSRRKQQRGGGHNILLNHSRLSSLQVSIPGSSPSRLAPASRVSGTSKGPKGKSGRLLSSPLLDDQAGLTPAPGSDGPLPCLQGPMVGTQARSSQWAALRWGPAPVAAWRTLTLSLLSPILRDQEPLLQMSLPGCLKIIPVAAWYVHSSKPSAPLVNPTQPNLAACESHSLL